MNRDDDLFDLWDPELCGDPRAVPGRGPLYKGSKSEQKSTTTTTNVDKRQVVDGGSVGLTLDGNGNSVQVLDGGAIDASFEFAGESLEQMMDLAGRVLDAQEKGTALAHQAASSVGEAYKTAQEISSGQRMLVAGGLIIAGIVAVQVFGKK